MLTIDRRYASPNHGTRPAGVAIDCIVLHADAGASEAGTLDWITRPESQVSYHYLVGRDGRVWQCVEDHRRAWHAGKSAFLGRNNCNDYSIGVSFANDQLGETFPGVQLDAGAALCADLLRAHPAITPDRITTHAIVAPGRKHDPGPLFPMAYFIGRVKAL